MADVSVVLPVCNGVAYIKDAVASVLGQTLRELELIVIDDGSTDGTARVLDGFGDPRLRRILHERPRGVAVSLNEGLVAATAPLVARMDADDVCEPHRLRAQADFLLRQGDIDIVGSSVRCILPGRSFVYAYPRHPAVVRAYLLFDNPLAHPAVCVRRDSLERAGLRYDETLPAAQDYDLWSRAAEVLRMDNLRTPLLRYRMHDASVSSSRGSESDAQALRIQGEWLARLGIVPTDGERRLHRETGHGAGCESRAALTRAAEWLRFLDARNDTASLFPRRAFRCAASIVWLRVCLNTAHLGPAVLLDYLSLALRFGPPPFPREAAALLAGVVATAAGRGAGGPGGRLASWRRSA